MVMSSTERSATMGRILGGSSGPHVFHWKHGWIPIGAAAASEAKGIQSHEDVLNATHGLPNIPEGPHRDAARQAIEHASARLNPSRSAQLTAAADAKHAEAARAAGAGDLGDRAAGRLSGAGLKQAGRRTDSALRHYTEAEKAAKILESKAYLAAAREHEAARVKLTAEDLKGAKHVKDKYGWHEVVRVNGKTVTVKTPYSWTDTIAHGKILAVNHGK